MPYAIWLLNQKLKDLERQNHRTKIQLADVCQEHMHKVYQADINLNLQLIKGLEKAMTILADEIVKP